APPFRVALARGRGAGPGAFWWPTGGGGGLDPASPLAREPFLAVAEVAGRAAQSRILAAAPMTLTEIEAHFADRIVARAAIAFDAANLSLRGRDGRRLGAIVLSERPVRVVADEISAKLLADGVADVGTDRLPRPPPLTHS